MENRGQRPGQPVSGREGSRDLSPLPTGTPACLTGRLSAPPQGPGEGEGLVRKNGRCFQWSPNVHPSRELLAELRLVFGWKWKVGHRRSAGHRQRVAFQCGVFSPRFVRCLCGIFGNEFLQPEGGPGAPGRRKAEPSPPHQAEGKVRSHRVAGGGRNGRGSRSVPSDPERPLAAGLGTLTFSSGSTGKRAHSSVLGPAQGQSLLKKTQPTVRSCPTHPDSFPEADQQS